MVETEDDFEGRRRGRPATGKSPAVCIRVPKERMARVDAFAAEEFLNRGEAINELIERGLKDDKK